MRRGGLEVLGLAALAAVSLLARPAQTQVAASLSVETDDRYRGISLTGGRPDARLNLSWDTPWGVYSGASLVEAETYHGRARFAGYVAWVGYSRRATPFLSLDLGVTTTRMSIPVRGEDGAVYKTRTDDVETYVGFSSEHLSGRVFYSPDYLHQGVRALYSELDGSVRPAPKIRLFGHVGRLTVIGGQAPWPYRPEDQWDARAGAAGEIGPLTLELAFTAARPGEGYPPGLAQSRDAVVLRADWAF